jgi:PadR family transcriptional regulator PadR
MLAPYGRSMESTVLPRDHFRASLLLVIAEAPAHGYDVAGLLAPLGLGTADRPSVYRMLRAMDAEGLVFSSWDTSPAGPSRRIYRLTPAGRRWAATATAGLRDVDGIMKAWLARYRDVARHGVEAAAAVPAAS